MRKLRRVNKKELHSINAYAGECDCLPQTCSCYYCQCVMDPNKYNSNSAIYNTQGKTSTTEVANKYFFNLRYQVVNTEPSTGK